VNRVEGLAVGTGVTTKIAPGLLLITRARYGIDDKQLKGSGQLRWQRPTGSYVEAFGSRENVDIGDVEERSTVVNSLASQEFGSDLSDPYRVNSVGARTVIRFGSVELGLKADREWHDQLFGHATPVTGFFSATPTIRPLVGDRLSASAYRPLSSWAGPGQLQLRVGAGWLRYDADSPDPGNTSATTTGRNAVRATLVLDHKLSIGTSTLVSSELLAGVVGTAPLPAQELVYFGGPISAPGYALHSISGSTGSSTRVELQIPVPFISIPLGRFGRIPGQAHLAPYVSEALVAGTAIGGSTCIPASAARCPFLEPGGYPSVGLGLLTVFDILRFDVARGLRQGRWMFNVDVTKEFWNIL
jgi:hypothetical protein